MTAFPETPSTRPYPPSMLTPEEAKSLLDVCGNDRVGFRNRALIAILYRAGPRVAEALGVDWPNDVRWEGSCARLRLRVVKGSARGAPPREIGLDRMTSKLLKNWLLHRSLRAGPLFCTSTGARVLTSYVRRILPQLGKRAGIEKRVHAHGLRHTFAREFYEFTKDLVRTSRALGHSNVATTDGYLRSIGVTQAAEENMARPWAKTA